MVLRLALTGITRITPILALLTATMALTGSLAGYLSEPAPGITGMAHITDMDVV